MGFEAFKLLWEQRERYDLVLLLQPLEKVKRQFSRYEKEEGIHPFKGAGLAEGKRLKIVWGDVRNRADVTEACKGINICLSPMAFISPAADRDPEMAHEVNYLGVKNIVEAIEAENPEHIRLVYIGSVAEYGDRLPDVHVGRTGDPIIPSVYDHYALTKIKGELTVMQSRIRHRVSLRQTFIMIPGLFGLTDPIMFHQPVHSFMENITARDAGRVLVNCLEVPGDSDFWRGYYNISGGPMCRTTFLQFLDRIYTMLGMNYRKVMERSWFALKNFHMMFYEDSGTLNAYLHHWEGGQTLEDYYREVWSRLPWYLKISAWYSKHIPPYRWLVQKIAYGQLKKLTLKQEGTMRWIKDGDADRIKAFFGSPEAQQSIGGWDDPLPSIDHNLAHQRLDHGYDESKKVLDISDLQKAAQFRGGSLSGDSWSGEMHQKVPWTCGQGHSFEMTPHAVLKGGHWCLECIAPPWKSQQVAITNPFAAQVHAIELYE